MDDMEQHEPLVEPLWTMLDLPKALGIGRTTVQRWVADGKIPPGRYRTIGSGRQLWTGAQVAQIRAMVPQLWRGRK